MPLRDKKAQGQIAPDRLVIGQVLRPHGLRGELRVQILSGTPERFKFLGKVGLTRDADASAPVSYYEVERSRLHQGFAILQLAGIEEREQADALRGQMIVVALDEAVPLEEGEYYYFQLIGLEMVTDTGRSVGVVTEILETGANEVYVVEHPQHGEILIPAIESVIQEIDLDAGKIVIIPLDGLLPDDA